MKLQEMTKEELQEVSMVEVAFEIMKSERKPFDYYDLIKEVAKIKGMSKEEINQRIANLYTAMNIDGRFHSLGDNNWGLKSWYALEQSEEEITTPVKPRKKAKIADTDLDAGFDDFDEEYEDLEDELDELAIDDDADDDDDTDVADFDDKEDLDEDLDDDDDDDSDDLEDEDDDLS